MAEEIEELAAKEGPRFSSRKKAWLDGYKHGKQHIRLTGGKRLDLKKITEVARLKYKTECYGPGIPLWDELEDWKKLSWFLEAGLDLERMDI